MTWVLPMDDNRQNAWGLPHQKRDSQRSDLRILPKTHGELKPTTFGELTTTTPRLYRAGVVGVPGFGYNTLLKRTLK